MTPGTWFEPSIAHTRPMEAAKALGMSYDSFVLYVRPHLRCVRLGSLVLYPVPEIERFLTERASSVMEDLVQCS